MTRKNDPPTYVTRAECSRISGKISREIETLKIALVGENMRGGLIKEINEMKSSLKNVTNYIDEQKKKGRDWRMLAFAILGSIISGTVVALLTKLIG